MIHAGSFSPHAHAGLVASVLCALLAACTSNTVVPATEVIVRVRVDAAVFAAASTLRIDVDGSPDGLTFDRRPHMGSSRALPGPGEEVRVALTPLDGDATRIYRVTATAIGSLDDVVAVARVISGYRAGATLEYELLLERSCLRVLCVSELETCRGGACVAARVPTTELMELGDAGASDGGTPSDMDVDECALGTDDCEDAVAVCANTVGSFTCECVTGFAGEGHGAGGCLWDDPSLSGLIVGPGASLVPGFSSTTLAYFVSLPIGAASTTLLPVPTQPLRTTLTVNGVALTPGTSADVVAGFAPSVASIVVRAESGATRTYTVVVGRAGSVYTKPSNTGSGDQFGTAIALSADGTRLAVGALGEASRSRGVDGDPLDDGAPSAGAVYVFSRSGSTWTQEAYIKASNSGREDEFGSALSLSGDGSRLAVGAHFEDSIATGIGGVQNDESVSGAGAVYVFARDGTTWAQEAYIKASNTGAALVGDQFGWSVSLSADGGRLAVGAPLEASNARGIDGDQSNNSAFGSGAVYLFSRVGTSWAQQAYIKASNADGGDFFGFSVSLSGDGMRLAVGAKDEDSSATGIGGDQANNGASMSGAVYVFTLAPAGRWLQEAYVKASNTGASDAFGNAVSLSGDGMRLAVGAFSEDSNTTGIDGDQLDNTLSNSGAAYLFSRSAGAMGAWTQEAYLKASNSGANDEFGFSVSLSTDGTRLAVSGWSERSNATGINGDETDDSMPNSGAVYVFSHATSVWLQEAYVKASNPDISDNFGRSICLSGDGARLAVGASEEDSAALGIGGDQLDNTAVRSGAVYIF